MSNNIYNIKPMPRKARRPHFSITIDAVVKMQLEQFCKVTDMNRSEAIEAILYQYFRPTLEEVENCGKEERDK